EKKYPKFFTFKSYDDFKEDLYYRHIEPSSASHLELHNMDSYNLKSIKTLNPKIQLYMGIAKRGSTNAMDDVRFFLRTFIYRSALPSELSLEYVKIQGERIFIDAICELEVVMSSTNIKKVDRNHVFVNFISTVIVELTELIECFESILKKYCFHLWKLRVLDIELKVPIQQSRSCPIVNVKLFVDNKNGYIFNIFTCTEVFNLSTGELILETYKNGEKCTSYSLTNAYALTTPVQHKRYHAQKMGTSYVHDIPEMFQQMLEKLWKEYGENRPNINLPYKLMEFFELVLNKEKEINIMKRPPGTNDVGMVAWLFTLFTPEYPEGRDIVVIANDITHVSGSFSPLEDFLFFKASEMARKKKIPRIYISANSGARIGLAEELKNLFRIAWEDREDPNKGFRYLYLKPDDYAKVHSMNSVQTQIIEDEGELRHQITAIIGKEEGIGVENLQGAGLIAGETSKAYQEVVTISMVSCRAIGIGSYLIRLGQRVIQVQNSHIILTGYQALNKLLGREVYSSNNQLGGIQIMYNNGITHQTASHDFDGIYKILKWLSYMPKDKLSSVPIMDSLDPIDRPVEYKPTKLPYDPRWMLEGRPHPHNTDEWESGFLDKGSWDEIMKPWAQSVVCGRGRLGGIPVGIIAVETQTINVTLPADPANENSESKTVTQAGQVWYPDSSQKTAQVIQDFGKEGLPLIIFSNWRGFSGGKKDMFEQVMKFGSYIIDQLREYTQPILVYIPPNGELRGGAWAVLDKTINPSCIEMYADPESRGGVLGPEGIVEIRFRAKDLIKSMHQNDSVIGAASVELEKADLSMEMRAGLEKTIAEREQYLMPIYLQVAIHFADLHDVPCRMKEKSVIMGTVPWRQSRYIFYCRLKRLLLEYQAANIITRIRSNIAFENARLLLRKWFIEENEESNGHTWEDNLLVTDWLQRKVGNDQTHSLISHKLLFIKNDLVLEEIKSTNELYNEKTVN
ncbi:Acetyl-CoA carboxylase, partial [Gryllus bimaculatus]